jgi:hypothetical protein
MEPADIWQLIVKADERLKYAAGGAHAMRREQAAGFLLEALTEAEAAGDEALAGQARSRLADLDHALGTDRPESQG